MTEAYKQQSNASPAVAPTERRRPKRKGILSRLWKKIWPRHRAKEKTKLEKKDGERGYQQWVALYDTITGADRSEIRRHLGQLAFQPLISVVMPAYESNENTFRQAIESVLAQLYKNWELCVADDASPSPHVTEILREFAAKDGRVKWMRRDSNGHISAATNSALSLATGEFVALMDHDDILREHALYEVVAELNAHPDADLIYSDEDKIDDAGRRYNPYFKTDWNPELFLCHNMVSHLGVYRRTIVEKIGGLRVGFEGSQDYDLALRVSRETIPERIRHIPAILYHWRSSSGNPSFSEGQLQRCVDVARRAKAEHLAALGDHAIVEGHPTLQYWERIRRVVPTPAPLVSLIIPTRNRADLLRPCLEGIFRRTNYQNFEIIIIDHESDEPETIALLQEIAGDPRVRIIPYKGAFNYSDMNNKAVELAHGELIGLLNNDVDVIDPEWLTEMVALAARPTNGAVGAKLLYPDGRVQHAGVLLGVGAAAGHFHHLADRVDPGYLGRLMLTSNVSAVTGACLIVRKSIFEEVGGFNAADLPVAFSDVDFCLKVRAKGYRNVWTPYASLYHHKSPSRGPDTSPDKLARFKAESRYITEKWGEDLQSDPYYNLNFGLDTSSFDLAFPPRRVKPWLRPHAQDGWAGSTESPSPPPETKLPPDK